MPKYFLWCVDNIGNVYSLSTWDSTWHKIAISLSKINKFKAVAASQWCIWCVGCDDQIYLLVPNTEIIIRISDTVIENERKSGGIFSGEHLKKCDPSNFFDEKFPNEAKPDLNSYKLPSTRWTWEDSWKLKKRYNGEPTENEGWVYSSAFNQPFQSRKSKILSNVRRRYWQRFRYFSACDRWLLIPQDTEHVEVNNNCDVENLELGIECINGSRNGIVDIACGGEMLPHQNDGFLTLWIVNAIGQVLFRKDIWRQNPEGSYWCIVELPEFVRALSVSVGPLGNVIICSTDGSMFFRKCITWKNPIGLSWKELDCPDDLFENERIIQTTTSPYFIWARSNMGRLWARNRVNLHEVEDSVGHSWILVSNDVSFISSSPFDQLWSLNTSSNKIQFRLSKSFGKFWTGSLDIPLPSTDNMPLKIVHISSNSLVLEDNALPTTWLHSSKGFQKMNILETDADWRLPILERFIYRDTNEYQNPKFSSYTSVFEQVSWSKAVDCEAFSCISDNDDNPRWIPVTVVVHNKTRLYNTDKATIHVISKQMSKSSKDLIPFIDSTDVICVSKYMFPSAGICERCLMLNIQIKSNSPSKNSDIRLLLKFRSESEVEDWITTFTFISINLFGCKSAYGKGNIWILNQFYEPFYCQFLNDDSYDNRWYLDGGHFRIIESGNGGKVTWAVGFNGVAWVHTNGTGGSYLGAFCNSKDLYEVSDSHSVRVWEYEKLKFIRGMTSGRFVPHLFVDNCGNVIFDRKSIFLFSKRWQWVDDWSVDLRIDNGNCDSEGWQFSTGLAHKFNSTLTWSKNYRRRSWIRMYRTLMLGPWKEVSKDSIKIACISISPTSDDNSDSCSIWAVTENGDLLKRKGVRNSCPEGLEWLHVRTDHKFQSVSVSNNGKLWIVDVDGFLWHLKISFVRGMKISNEDLELVKHPNPGGKFVSISSGDSTSAWAIDSTYQLWCRQYNHCAYNSSFGCCWIYICNQVLHVSCASWKKIWAVFIDGKIAERIGLSSNCLMGTGWNYKVIGIGTYTSVRGA